MISKVPELAEQFNNRIVTLVSDKNHALIMGGVSLAHQICLADASLILQLKEQLVPVLIRQLQSIIAGGMMIEYDVNGICDPFLQVRILRLLRFFGEGDCETSEAMSDILTQIATSTDPSRNVGHAVLYETAVTIMNIESDQSLRTMAINILGRLLSSNNSDNNLRYVALTLLNKIIAAGHEGLSAVQRHRATILECIHETDTSIRRRAVDLALALISKDTIKSIASELLDVLKHLEGGDELEFKQSLVTRLAIASAQHAPSAKWYVDTMIVILGQIDDRRSLGLCSTVLSEDALAGRKEEIVSTFVRIINNTAELYRYATEELWKVVTTSATPVSEALIQACVWTIGEFADILISARLSTEDFLVTKLAEWSLLQFGHSPALISYIITALGKLANRLPSTYTSMITSALETIAADHVNNTQIHYRAKEMCKIAGDRALSSVLMARIPPDVAGDQLGRVASASFLTLGSRPPSANRMNKTDSASVHSSPSSTPQIKPVMDVFAELATLSLDGATSPATKPTNDDASHTFTHQSSNRLSSPSSAAFEHEGVKIYFGIGDTTGNETNMIAKIYNDSFGIIEHVQLQIAVPKSMKIRLLSADRDEASPGGYITQQMFISQNDPEGGQVAASRDKIKLRVKFNYQTSNMPQTHLFDVSKFN